MKKTAFEITVYILKARAIRYFNSLPEKYHDMDIFQLETNTHKSGSGDSQLIQRCLDIVLQLNMQLILEDDCTLSIAKIIEGYKEDVPKELLQQML